MRVGDIQSHPMNPKIHPEGQLAPLRGLLETVGKLDDLKAYRSERAGGALVFFDGHGRQELDPDAEWDVDIYDLTDEEADLAVATFDPIGWQAEQSRLKLDELLREVSTGNAALMELIAKEAAAGIIPGMGSKAPGAGGDDFDTTPEETQTRVRYGDLWQCGEHRVLCGDSTNAEDVARIIADFQPFMMVTDPPYGVDYHPEWRDESVDGELWKSGKRMTGKVTNDDRCDWSDAWKLFPGSVVYCWHADRHASEVQRSLENADFQMRSQIIWVKQHFALSRGDYHWQHEPCWYAVRKGKASNWGGDRTQSTRWDIASLNPMGGVDEGKSGHGTQKPIECMLRPIRNHGQPGDVIYDPFIGSGTTLIAAERTSRKCLGVEIEPVYCEMALRRWEAETGKQAQLLERGSLAQTG